jgi:hypothetical protein
MSSRIVYTCDVCGCDHTEAAFRETEWATLDLLKSAHRLTSIDVCPVCLNKLGKGAGIANWHSALSRVIFIGIERCRSKTA